MHHLSHTQVKLVYSSLLGILDRFTGVKVLVNSRSDIRPTNELHSISFEIPALDPHSMARLLINLTPRTLKFDEMKIHADKSQRNSLSIIASHPVVRRTRGIPGLISRLAKKMTEYRLDDLYELQR